jgi:hypothetical protein
MELTNKYRMKLPTGKVILSYKYHIQMSKLQLNESGKRLLRDLKTLKKDPPTGIGAAPIDSNLYVFVILEPNFIEMGRRYHRVGFLFYFCSYL